MKLGREPHNIVNVDRIENSVVVNFATGELALFDSHFLFAHKNIGQNRVVAADDFNLDDEVSGERRSA
jgi:hypothetical protein